MTYPAAGDGTENPAGVQQDPDRNFLEPGVVPGGEVCYRIGVQELLERMRVTRRVLVRQPLTEQDFDFLAKSLSRDLATLDGLLAAGLAAPGRAARGDWR